MKNDVLNRELEEAARALLDEVARRRRTGALPVHIVRRLVRGTGVGEFYVAEEENPDWSAALAQACTAVSSKVRSEASDQALDQGLVSDEPTSGSADRVCGSVLVPVLARYIMLAGQRDEFDTELFATCLKELRANRGADRVPMVALAPLHNLTSTEDEIELADDLAIVRITDGDRNDLLTQFGDWFKAPFATARLLWWTHAVRVRYQAVSGELAPGSVAAIGDVVSALRLDRPGAVGTTIVWERPDPPDTIVTQPWAGGGLWAPHGIGQYVNPPAHHLVADDVGPLRELLRALRSAKRDPRFALAVRRFDQTFERLETEDRLIDCWIALESLVVPDGSSELSYRASLRIGAFLGASAAERRTIFERLRRSYAVRSKLVHGDRPPHDLHAVLDQTEQTVRQTLRSWALNPPDGGVNELDARLLS